MGLTRPFLIYLFGHQGKRGQYFHHYFDGYLCHSCGRRWDLGINIEADQEVFNRLEQINERIITRIDVLERLRRLIEIGIRDKVWGEHVLRVRYPTRHIRPLWVSEAVGGKKSVRDTGTHNNTLDTPC